MFDNGPKEIFKAPVWLNTNENNFTNMNRKEIENGVLTGVRLLNGSNQSHGDKPNDE